MDLILVRVLVWVLVLVLILDLVLNLYLVLNLVLVLSLVLILVLVSWTWSLVRNRCHPLLLRDRFRPLPIDPCPAQDDRRVTSVTGGMRPSLSRNVSTAQRVLSCAPNPMLAPYIAACHTSV